MKNISADYNFYEMNFDFFFPLKHSILHEGFPSNQIHLYQALFKVLYVMV